MPGDFLPFLPGDWEIRSLETKSNARKARISGPVRRRLRTVPNRRTGWLGREDSNIDMANSKSDALPLSKRSYRTPFRNS